MVKSLARDTRFYQQLHAAGSRSAIIAWARVLFGSPGLLILASHRLAHALTTFRADNTAAKLQKLVLRLAAIVGTYLCTIFTKSNILESTALEDTIYFSDLGHIILGASFIGAGTIIHDHVTVGMNMLSLDIPRIGRNVWIGHHSVINGGITLGDGVTVLPYTVLTKSLPPGVVVQGNPARIVRRDFDNTALRRTLATDFDQTHLEQIAGSNC